MDENPSGVRISPSPQKCNKNMKKNIILLILSVGLLLSQKFDKVGSIYYLDGDCNISNEIDDSRNLSAILGSSINNFDIIVSAKDSQCEIIFDDNKTKIDLLGKSKIHINNTKFSREISLDYGKIIVENSKSEIKTYISTNINDIYINNNKVFIESDYVLRHDKVFSTDKDVNVYNKNSESRITLPAFQLVEIDHIGQVAQKDEHFSDFLSKSMRKNILQEKKYTVFLNPSDLIPVYNTLPKQKKSKFNFNIDYALGTRNMNTKNYLELGLYPYFHINDFLIGANVQFFVDGEGNIFDNWDEGIDILENVQISYQRYINNDFILLSAGHLEPITFGHGYLVRDFLEFRVFIPSFRDYINDGGVFALHSSLFISHKFPLKLGFGLIFDINQASSASQIYSFSNQSSSGIKRSVSAAEIDYTYNLVKKMNLEISLYGELSGIWYPEDIYYMKEDGSPYGDDLRWRKGSWGILGPGISIEIQNRYKMNLAFATNSAGHLSSYFNNNYMLNRSVYYNANNVNLEFPLIFEQISMINEFLIDEDEYLVPKDIYPILSNSFNAFPVYGLVAEFKYNYKNRVNLSSMGSLYFQQRENTEAGHYYSIESKISIKDNVIRNVDFLNFYLSNLFFWSAQDKDKMIFGFDIGFELPKDITLVMDLNQIFYDGSMNGSVDSVINFGMNVGMNF